MPAFRSAAHALVDGVADHLAALPSRPLAAAPALREELLELPLPEHPVALDDLVATALRDVLPHAMGTPAITPMSTSSVRWCAGWPSSSASARAGSRPAHQRRVRRDDRLPCGRANGTSSTVFHRSGPNSTDHVRRVYVAQYSTEPVLSEDRSRPRHLAEPLLVDGEPVHRPELTR